MKQIQQYNYYKVYCILYIIINQFLIQYQYLSTMKEQNQGLEEVKTHVHVLKGKQALNDIQKALEKDQNQFIQQIRNIKNSEVELQVNQHLTEQIKSQNEQKIKQITKDVLYIEKKMQIVGNLKEKEDELDEKQYNQIIRNQIKSYQPDQHEIKLRFDELVLQPNDSNWTDATQSQADQDEVWAVDEDIMKAMQEQQQQFGEQAEEEKDNEQQKQGQKQQVNLQQLEEQFVVGQQSDHQVLFGKHDKFCVSVNGLFKNDLLVSGGGDDYLYMYHFPKQLANKDKCFHPYHIVKHTETINKIQISYSKQYIFTMTDNQILCTEIKTQQTKTLKSKKQNDKKQNKEQQKQEKQQKMQEKANKNNKEQSSQSDSDEQPICSDMVCHHLGDVVAVSAGYELQVFNIKGLKLYQTYYCDKTIDMIAFTESGKQIVLACEDSKLRLLTPKTSEIVTVAGVKQHKAQISSLKTKGDIILSGCIDGNIGVTSIKKAAITTFISTKQKQDHNDVDGAINQLEFAGSYFMAGSAYDRIDWYDLSKTKKLFQSQLQGSPSDICWQGSEYQHLYNVSTIKGIIHLFDCRNPLKQVAHTRAGNTIHKMWADNYNLAAACEDGHLRLFDIRKLL